MKKIHVLFLLLISTLILSAATVSAEAPPKPSELKNLTIFMCPDAEGRREYDIKDRDVSFPSGTYFTDIMSSSTNITVEEEFGWLNFYAKKPGKAVVTFNAEYKGKKYKYKVNVTAYWFKGFFKSIKVNDKELVGNYLEYPSQDLRFRPFKNKKLSFKMKSGYVVKDIQIQNEKHKVLKKGIKSGDTISMKMNQYLYFVVYCKKSGETYSWAPINTFDPN